jgi:hypothetical protein
MSKLATDDDDKCEAVRIAGVGCECGRCALAWDEGDVRPVCAPVTYARLRDAALTAAERIEQSQRALVAAGDRRFRYQPEMQRAMELRAIVRLIDKITTQRGGKHG